MDCPPVSPGGGSEVPEALLEPGLGAGLTGRSLVSLMAQHRVPGILMTEFQETNLPGAYRLECEALFVFYLFIRLAEDFSPESARCLI